MLSRNLHTLLKLTFFILIFMAVGSLSNSNKVFADCGINNNNPHDYAGVVADVQAVKSDGVTVDTNADFSNTSFTVATRSPSSSGGQNVVNPNNDADRVASAVFVPGPKPTSGTSCGGYPIGVVLGRDSPSTDTNGKSWALDCDISLHADHYQSFGAYMQGLVVGHTGHWSAHVQGDPSTNVDPNRAHDPLIFAPPNGTTTTIVFQFIEDATPPPTQTPTPAGTLTCTSPTTSSISLSYDYSNTPSGANVTRDATYGPNSTTVNVDSTPTNHGIIDGGTVSQGNTYTYYLVQRGSGTPPVILAQKDCTVLSSGGSSGTPMCSMTATPSSINPGDTTSIGYSSSGGATSVTVQDSGSTISSGSASGSISRSPSATTTYTGSTVGGGSSGSCSVTVTVSSSGGGGGCTSNCGGTAPTGTVTASCTDLKVTIKQNDPNVASGQSTYFQLYVDANEQTPQQQQQFTSPSGQVYFTVASQTGTYTYTLPAGYADGRQHNFVAIPYDSTGTPNNNAAYVGAMIPCNATPPVKFSVTGSAGVTLHDDEAPTSYSSNYTNDGDHYTITPDSSTGGSVAISCSISITKNGNPLGTATDCSGTSPANSTPVAVTGPSGSDTGVAGDKYCSFITLSPSKGTINADGTVTPTAPAVTTPGNCATVANKPYFKVYNSSVATGGQVGACLSDPGALASWYNNAGGNNYGSSAQLGAYALAHITGFASNQTGSRPPDGLSFANTTGTAADKNSPPLGGQFGGRNCITSPAEPPLSGTTVNAAGGYYPPVNLASIFGGSPSSQAYSYGSASTPAQVELQIGGSKLRAGHSVGIYVAGDVYISDDIVYDQSRWGVDGVPSFVLSVKGNIYIAPGVKNLMGTYEAQKNGASGGNIYTCASAAFRPSTSANRLYATCGTQLTVTGSFVADKLNLQRTFGTLHNETGGPCSNSNGGANASPNNHNTCAAEVFEFSPSQYLEKPAARPSGNGAQQYDAIVSLPPVL
jgi:hypothetical protein